MNVDLKENTMIKITITLALLASAMAVPVAQAEPPDAFERAVIAHRHALNADAVGPDAFERAVAAHRDALNAPAVPIERHSPDVQDAAVGAQSRSRSDRVSYGPLDPAIAAAIRTHRSAVASGPTARGDMSDRFDWSDFGVGAGAMLALVLSIGTLRRGALIVRARQSQALKV
jgi:hypothetical protein